MGDSQVKQEPRIEAGLRSNDMQFGCAEGHSICEPLCQRALAIFKAGRDLGNNDILRADTNVLAERLLSISGEDNQSIEIKYEKSWSGKLYTRFVIMTNELPRINDASGALTSRIVLLTMRQSFYNRENLDLTHELLEELPGIFNWSLAGLARLRERRRFLTPQSSKQAIELLEDLASPVGAFVRKWCVTGPDEYEKVHVLYDAYCKWCELEGHKPSSDAMFGRHLRGFLSTIIWKGRGRDRKYVGISLSQDGFDQYESLGRRD